MTAGGLRGNVGPGIETTVTSLSARRARGLADIDHRNMQRAAEPTGKANVTEAGSALSRSRTSAMLLTASSAAREIALIGVEQLDQRRELLVQSEPLRAMASMKLPETSPISLASPSLRGQIGHGDDLRRARLVEDRHRFDQMLLSQHALNCACDTGRSRRPRPRRRKTRHCPADASYRRLLGMGGAGHGQSGECGNRQGFARYLHSRLSPPILFVAAIVAGRVSNLKCLY